LDIESVEPATAPRFAAPSVFAIATGPYRGEYLGISPPSESLRAQLLDLVAASGESGRMLSGGPHGVALRHLEADGRRTSIVVKSFARNGWRDAHFARNGSKACASFRVARRLADNDVGTPMPIAWLDRWQGGKLLEAHYLCEFEQGASFRDELNRLFREDPLARRVLSLLETVAQAVAGMHDAGVCHMDLGNQNILVERVDPDQWRNVRILDLDRARMHEALSLRLRARDISRLDIPSALLPVFASMYFARQPVPRDFSEWEARYRRRFALHTATRRYRHPIRAMRARRMPPAAHAGPGRKHLWLWDDLSEQAIGTRNRAERQADYPWANGFYVLKGAARGGLPVRGLYRDLLAGAFGRRVAMGDRIGMAIGRSLGHSQEEDVLLKGLGRIPALVRLHRHMPEAANAEALAQARGLHAAGHSIHLALVQDRACLRDPALWEGFVERWLPQFAGIARSVEIGHATNREKFGVRDFREYRRMALAVARTARAAGGFELTGPAAIDFEYQAVVGLLEVLPERSLDAMSHHLYVDRRGGPENRQGRFSAVEKFALAKAIATWSRAVKGDRLVVSEVNWPLAGTGVHSPVSAPYIFPNARRSNSAVDEETYASFMIRYYALALCSGFVDAVYWWRLVARGFGLVDDTQAPWRPRPAYAALKTFVALLGDAAFVEKLQAADGTWALRFESPAAGDVVMAWAHPGPAEFTPPFAAASMLSLDGREQPATRGAVSLTGRPIYLVGAR